MTGSRALSDQVSDNRHRQRDASGHPRTICRRQTRRAAVMAVRACTWLRDEKAASSNPATPTSSEGMRLVLVRPLPGGK
jgi:hypothetical protein